MIPGMDSCQVITAMVSPMTDEGALDLGQAAALAKHLLSHGSDGLLINGTTGEAPTTSDEEKCTLLSTVVNSVPAGTAVWAGVGGPDTRHTMELAKASVGVGATGLLVVSPYYSKPPQNGIIQHFLTIADCSEVPIMIYDIPGRSAVALSPETIVTLGEHPNIVALKDAKQDFASTSWVRAHSEIAIFAGDDLHLLSLLALGAVGVVGVSSHVVGNEMREMINAFKSGELEHALELHLRLLPIFLGLFKAPNPMLTKAALSLIGVSVGPTRLPFVDPTQSELRILRSDMELAGVDCVM